GAAEACRRVLASEPAQPEALHMLAMIALENDGAEEAETLLGKIKNAGATFLGNFSPVALGDYVAGPSHVLPTGGTARWASGLSANDFLRSSSVISFTEQALNDVGGDVQRMADKEGLTAHRASVDIRLGKSDSSP
ncbi:MAG: histidinol dehydrogenase, partial [Planctomycetes bacterium]|nr:histidinol dehydrogenase [Planctomycetota bacterium]